MLGPGSMSQSSVRPIDFPTPRYHSDSSSTKALCPSQIIRSKELLSWDKVASVSTVPHTSPTLIPPSLLLSVAPYLPLPPPSEPPVGNQSVLPSSQLPVSEIHAQQMTACWGLVYECIIRATRAGTNQYASTQMKEEGRCTKKPLLGCSNCKV